MKINIASIHHDSFVNGPGSHSVIHFQGCNLKCFGCFNQELQSEDEKFLMTPEEILNSINKQNPQPSGIVISGGEPLLQPEGVRELLKFIMKTDYRVILYTGFTLTEIDDFHYDDIVSMSDLLLAGPYFSGKEMVKFPYTKSKEMIYFSNRYRPEDFNNLKRFEIRVGSNGVTILGFPADDVIRRVKRFIV
jgi:anaerobic ribonucleoside-triphosphate reductase activating protein